MTSRDTIVVPAISEAIVEARDHVVRGGDLTDQLVEADVWTALPDTGRALDRSARTVSVIGRLEPGATVEAAQAEIRGVMRQLGEAYPATNGDFDVLVSSYAKNLFGNPRQIAAILLSAVGLVLLIACANVASLLITRGVARAREVAVRAAGNQVLEGDLLRHLAGLHGQAALLKADEKEDAAEKEAANADHEQVSHDHEMRPFA